MIGELYDKTPVSAYQPSKDVQELTDVVKKDFSYGNEILTRSWVELNDMSVIDRMNRDQRTFNAFVDDSVEDVSEAWKWRGTRSKARNKAIAMHAQLTAGYIIPMFMAQNEDDEEDRNFSDFMRDIAEWMVNNSNYKSSFLMTSMGMLVNPVTYLGAEYAEIYQKVKTKKAKGFETTEILDEVLSGFQAPVYSADQILISNAYEQNIQKHRCVIKRRYIDYTEAEAKYGEHENWPYVTRGIKALYNDADGLFYDVKDDDHPNLVEEVTYLNRREDTEICFIGGIYMGDSNVEHNPIRHRDNRNAPKYNVVPFGYQRVNEHFFYYKSLMNSMYWDDQLIDAQYQLGMNRMFLDTAMPVAVSGSDKIDSDVIFPNSVVAFQSADTKISPLLPQANLGNLFNAMSVVERSMDEASVSDTTAGSLPEASQKATSVAIAQRNAQTMLQGVGKTLAESVVQYGGLMADIALQHLTVPQVQELVGDSTKMKYRNFILPAKVVDGKEVSKVLKFDENLLGMEMTDDQRKYRNLDLLKEVDYPENKKHLYLINPELFARMKYLTRVEPERMFPKNEEFQQAMMLQLMPIFGQNPFVSLEGLTRKALYAFFRGESDELMQKQEQVMPGMEQLLGGAPQSQAGQMGQNRALSTGMQGMGVM